MLALLTRALAARAAEVASWDGGLIRMRDPGPPVFTAHRDGGLVTGGGSAEFRVEMGGPQPTTYVVTVTEVRQP